MVSQFFRIFTVIPLLTSVFSSFVSSMDSTRYWIYWLKSLLKYDIHAEHTTWQISLAMAFHFLNSFSCIPSKLGQQLLVCVFLLAFSTMFSMSETACRWMLQFSFWFKILIHQLPQTWQTTNSKLWLISVRTLSLVWKPKVHPKIFKGKKLFKNVTLQILNFLLIS